MPEQPKHGGPLREYLDKHCQSLSLDNSEDMDTLMEHIRCFFAMWEETLVKHALGPR